MARNSTIKPKKKKCRGTGKTSGHGCGLEFYERKLGLCPSCYADWLLNTEEGQARLEKHTLKATETRRSLEQAMQEKEDRTKLQWLKTNVQTWCHRYIKERDKGKPCISCGTPWHSEFQAGHWKKASDYSLLKYNEHNIHGQCKQCNLMKDGNVQKYEDRLRFRITKEQFAEVVELAKQEKMTNFKWDREELNQLREYYKEKYHLQKAFNIEKGL